MDRGAIRWRLTFGDEAELPEHRRTWSRAGQVIPSERAREPLSWKSAS